MKFIKENWFKVIVVIILLLAIGTGYYYINRQHSLETLMKCNNDGQKFFYNYKIDKASFNLKFGEPTYHFNGKLNKCLISVDYMGSTHESLGQTVYDISHAEVVDIYSNETLISTENPKEDTQFQQEKQSFMNN